MVVVGGGICRKRPERQIPEIIILMKLAVNNERFTVDSASV